MTREERQRELGLLRFKMALGRPYCCLQLLSGRCCVDRAQLGNARGKEGGYGYK